MKYFVTVGADTLELELEVERRSDGTYVVRDGAVELSVRPFSALQPPGLVSLLVDGHTVEVQPADGEVRFRQERFAVRAENWRDRNATHSAPPATPRRPERFWRRCPDESCACCANPAPRYSRAHP